MINCISNTFYRNVNEILRIEKLLLKDMINMNEF